MRSLGLLVACLAVVATPLTARAASPFETGSTSIASTWELKTGITYKHERSKDSWVLPKLEVTAPISPFQEASIEISRGLRQEKSGRTTEGLRDLEAASKIRLYKGEPGSWIPTVAIEPTLVMPTGNAEKGLGDDEWRMTLPVALGWREGPFKVYAQLGYGHGFGRSTGGTIPFGALVLYEVSDTLTIGAEIAGERPCDVDTENHVVANIGLQWEPVPGIEIHWAVGRTLRDDRVDGPQFQSKAALQINF
jgi:hypothetical protein